MLDERQLELKRSRVAERLAPKPFNGLKFVKNHHHIQSAPIFERGEL